MRTAGVSMRLNVVEAGRTGLGKEAAFVYRRPSGPPDVHQRFQKYGHIDESGLTQRMSARGIETPEGRFY